MNPCNYHWLGWKSHSLFSFSSDYDETFCLLWHFIRNLNPCLFSRHQLAHEFLGGGIKWKIFIFHKKNSEIVSKRNQVCSTSCCFSKKQETLQMYNQLWLSSKLVECGKVEQTLWTKKSSENLETINAPLAGVVFVWIIYSNWLTTLFFLVYYFLHEVNQTQTMESITWCRSLASILHFSLGSVNSIFWIYWTCAVFHVVSTVMLD